MIFQVIRDGNVMFWTEHTDAIPSREEIAQLKKCGYKIKEISESKKTKKIISKKGDKEE